MTQRILFYVQHLLGMGHLMRATRIAGAMVAAGMNVELVLGGEPVEGLDPHGARVTYLPPVKAESANFSSLLTGEGTPADTDYLDRRRDMLLAIFDRVRPDALITEAYPFGRRIMRFELVPLIARARAMSPRPLIACSIRDILQRNPQPVPTRDTVAAIADGFDAVLVHGDRAFVAIEETFPAASEFAGKINYTGIVGPEPETVTRAVADTADVVVAAGGGRVGRNLMRLAMEAKAHTLLKDARWLCVTGPLMPAEDRAALTALGAQSGVRIAGFRPDLVALFAHARVAISQAGYNTVADLLAARCRSVLVPLAEGVETEQSDRATRLAERRLAVVVEEPGLSAQALAEAIDAASSLPPIPEMRFDGAAETARVVGRLIRDRVAT